MPRGSERSQVSAFDIDVLDTTGCGDACTAGFVAALADGHGMKDAALLGTASAPLVASGLGSDAGVRDRNATETLLRESRR